MRYIKNYRISSFLKNTLKERKIIYVEEIPTPLNKQYWMSLDNFGISCWYELNRLVKNDIDCIAIPYNDQCRNFKNMHIQRHMDSHLRNIKIFKDRHFYNCKKKDLAKKYNLSEISIKMCLHKLKKEIIEILSSVELTSEQYDNFFCHDPFYMDFFRNYARL